MLDEIEFYYNLLKFVGLMSVYYDKNEKCYKIKHKIKFYIYYIFLQITNIIAILLLFYYPEIFIFNEYKKTGNYFNHFATHTTSCLYILLNLWWILKQEKHFKLLETLRQWRCEYLFKRCCRNNRSFVKLRIGAIILVLIFYFCKIIHFTFEMNNFVANYFYLPWFTYYLRTVLFFVISSIYLCIVMSLTEFMEYVCYSLTNYSMQLNYLEIETFKITLLLYYEIMSIAKEDISCLYGVSIIVCILVVTMESISNAYLLAISEICSKNMIIGLHALSWMTPILIFLIIGLLSNRMEQQVNPI